MEDWAAIALVLLFVGLWFLWPRRVPPSGRGLPPEPLCAYITLPGDFPTGRERHTTRFTSGFPRLPSIPKPDAPPPMEAPVIATEPDAFTAVRVNPPTLPPTPPPPFAEPHAGTAGARISPALTAAGFTADIASVTSAAPYSLTASLSFDQTGRVTSLLIEHFKGDKTVLAPLRLSLLLSRTTGPATGEVTVWREAAAEPPQIEPPGGGR
jgi:hypothetical protein